MKCVYKITNTVNGKFYIGSTINFDKRKDRHIRDLRNNKHHNLYLQRSYNKYNNERLFIFEIIEVCDNPKEVEQALLDNLDWSKCYNISSSASGGDLTKNHPNIDNINKRRVEILNNIRKPVIRYGEENGNWRGGHKYFCECGAKIQAVNKTCLQCRDKAGEKNPFYGRSHSAETKRILSEQMKGRYIGPQEKPVIINNIEYKSISEAGRQLNIIAGTILHRVRSKNPKYANYNYKCLTTISQESTSQVNGDGNDNNFIGS